MLLLRKYLLMMLSFVCSFRHKNDYSLCSDVFFFPLGVFKRDVFVHVACIDVCVSTCAHMACIHIYSIVYACTYFWYVYIAPVNIYLTGATCVTCLGSIGMVKANVTHS